MTSPGLRARQTAEALNLEAEIEPLLRECDYGRWTGRSLADVQTEEPEALAQWLQAPDAAPMAANSLQDLLARVAQWLDAQNGEPGVTRRRHPCLRHPRRHSSRARGGAALVLAN